ncbi:MAG: Ig-like domain-containing protein, partial [Nitrospirota bacterium]
TGLAKNDKCNALATGAQVLINANRMSTGNVIAGTVSINKGLDEVQGTISYINFDQGYFRVNGNIIPPGGADDGTGIMVRINDPTGTHTFQKGKGCIPGNTVNCSPDVRFDVDHSNYTFNFLTGFPACIPSTAVFNRGAGSTPATPDGLNDSGCPHTPANAATDNRPDVTNPAAFTAASTALSAGAIPPSPLAGDSRRFAPIWVGDSIDAIGNFEVIGGVQFLSARAAQVQVDLTTDRARADQPEYLFIGEKNSMEVGLAVEGHIFKPRVRVNTSDHVEAVDVFTVHFDPVNNAPHERLFYTTECNKRQGPDVFVIPTGQFDMFVRMDFRANKKPIGFEPCLDFFGFDTQSECTPFRGNAPQGALAGIMPAAPAIPALQAQAGALCPAALAEFLVAPPVFPNKVGPPAGFNCTIGSQFCIDNYNIEYPTARQTVARGRRTEVGAITGQALDIHGRPAQSGFYFLPVSFDEIENFAMTFGMNATASNFDTLPWLLDRRLSTNGCVGPCETTPQPLSPFPFANIDPRDTAVFATPVTFITAYPTPDQFFATVPVGTPPCLTPPTCNVTTMSGTLLVGGTDPALALNPPAVAITPTPAFTLFAPVANDDSASTKINPALPVKIKVLANDIPLAGTLDVTTVQVLSTPASGTAQVNPDGTITYTPNALATAGTDTFTYTVANSAGAVSNAANVTITLIGAKTHTITALSDSKGTITPSSTMTVNDGGSQTFTFTPNTGYQIVDVVVDGKSVGVPASGTFSFPPIREDGHTISIRSIPDGTTKADGKADVSDALRAMKIALGLITPTANDLLHYRVAPLGPDGVPAPDCSPSIPQPCRSGTIGVGDALLILRKAAGFTTGF